QLVFDKQKYPEDKVMEVALEAGAQDVAENPGSVGGVTTPSDVYRLPETFEEVGVHPTNAGVLFLAKKTVPGAEAADAAKILQFLDHLEDHDDVQRVHSNLEIDDKIVAQLAGKG